jgi:hypothetical protein
VRSRPPPLAPADGHHRCFWLRHRVQTKPAPCARRHRASTPVRRAACCANAFLWLSRAFYGPAGVRTRYMCRSDVCVLVYVTSSTLPMRVDWCVSSWFRIKNTYSILLQCCLIRSPTCGLCLRSAPGTDSVYKICLPADPHRAHSSLMLRAWAGADDHLGNRERKELAQASQGRERTVQEDGTRRHHTDHTRGSKSQRGLPCTPGHFA